MPALVHIDQHPVAGHRRERSRVCRARRGTAGFSLIELLVAMVIGMIAIVVIMQMFSMFEAQRRTTSSGDDAISGGTVSLYELQRDLQQAGWGISAVPIIGCSVTGLVSGGAAIPLVPVSINPAAISGADANTDTLVIVTGNGNGSVEGDLIDSVPSGNQYAVHTPSAFAANDRVVPVPRTRPSPCSLALTSVSSVAAPNVTVAAGAAGIATNDLLFNLGRQPQVRAYAIRSGNLTVCDYVANNCGNAANNGDVNVWVPIASNVVSLRAQYGRDTATGGMDAIVDVWDRSIATSATPVSTNATKNTDACGLVRASAVRVVLVARSTQPEKTTSSGAHVTPNAPLWLGSDPAEPTSPVAAERTAVSIVLPSPDPTWPTWQDFRYKVFQTVIPMRNISTQGVPEEC